MVQIWTILDEDPAIPPKVLGINFFRYMDSF